VEIAGLKEELKDSNADLNAKETILKPENPVKAMGFSFDF